jgi:hypothetical protein
MSAGKDIFKLAFEISPIILKGGIAKEILGGMLPIIAITESLNFVDGLLSGGDVLNLDNYFAHFSPIPGMTLIEQQVGTYPFANQSVAANATIAQPLAVSLLMTCPAKAALGYFTKLATMTTLKATLEKHNLAGGTYTVATPSCILTNLLLLKLSDASNAPTAQSQTAWQWDFYRPLLTLDDAAAAENSLMSKITGGTAIDGEPTWSGLAQTAGSSIASMVSSIIPSASGVLGANVSGS